VARPNRYDVARTVGELSPATTDRVRQALAPDADSEQIDTAFERAEQHGFIERQPADGEATWTLSDKGREKLAKKAAKN
jgi:DNA-binding PadR family transcriptional regulator